MVPRRCARIVLVALILTAAGVISGCGDLATPQPTVGGVLIESAPASPTAPVHTGGKPAAPGRTPAPAASAAAADTPESAVLGATAVRDDPTASPVAAQTPAASATPIDGRWIDVDVTKFVVRLMDGETVVRTIQPVAVGAEVDTGNFASTQTGLFHVYNKIAGLQYDAPYDLYISDWVGFDIDKQNGFHSFLKDKDGKDTVTTTGRISNGCIRTAAAADIFAYADIGMPVLVHS